MRRSDGKDRGRMQHRLMTAPAVLFCFGALSGAFAQTPDDPKGGSGKPILTIYYIPFTAETFVGVTPTTIRSVPPMAVISPAVAADITRWLTARAGTTRFWPSSTHLLVIFADGRPDVLVDQFRGVSCGKAQYKLPQVEYDRLDALFRGMKDAREAAKAQALEDAKPALIKAVEKNDLAAVKQLLGDKADPNIRDRNGATALMLAADVGSVLLCETLIAGGADIDAEDSAHDTALGYAVVGGRIETFQWLLSRGADVKGTRGAIAFLDAVSGMPPETDAKTRKKIVDALLARNVPVESRDQMEDMTPLMWVIGEKNLTLMEEIIRRGGDVNAVDSYERTPLTWAAVTGDDPAIRLLLANGAVLNRKFRDGGTALTMAVIGNHISTVRLLLSYGANVSAQTLREAAAHRDHTILKLLRTPAKRKRVP